MESENIYKKKYGQNFLIDQNICEKIINLLNASDNDKVLEIGPGDGALTYKLFNKYKDNFYCVEIDEFYFNKLKNAAQNLNIFNKDFLKLDISSYNYVIGNVPYYITSEILLKLILNYKNIDQIVLMIQQDAYNRIVVSKNKDEKTPISILLKLVFDVTFNFNVSKEVFVPKPHISSTVFTLTSNKKYDFDARDFYNFLLICFNSRRKTLINNLSKKYRKEEILEVLKINNANLEARSEDLSKEDLLNIYLELKK